MQLPFLVSAAIAIVAAVTGADVPHVCIIGSGITGSSAAYFLSHSPGVKLTVLEQDDRVGGRLHAFDYRGVKIEAGGTIIHVDNKYMTGFAHALGLDVVRPGIHLGVGANERMAIFDGREFVVETSAYKAVTMAKMMWRYGPLNLRAMQAVVRRTIDEFGQIYATQDAGAAFTSPETLLTALNLWNTTQESLESIMTRHGVHPRLINELMVGITRVNYGQNTTMSGFGGLVGLAGSGADLRAIAGGVFQIPQGLLQKAGATVHLHSPVTAIAPADHGQYRVTTPHDEYTCDGVVLAAPVEEANLELPNSVAGQIVPRTSQVTHTAFVQGSLNATYFGVEDVPKMILTTENPSLLFTSIGLQYDKDGIQLYKIFSRHELGPRDLARLFTPGFEVVATFPWKAYPKFRVPEAFTPFELAPGLVYPNAIENAASAMEIGALSGRNAALLLQQHLKLERGSSEPRFGPVKEEL